MALETISEEHLLVQMYSHPFRKPLPCYMHRLGSQYQNLYTHPKHVNGRAMKS